MALSAPQNQDGDRLQPADIVGHTMVICPIEYIPHIQTVNTKAGEQSPAIRVNVAVLSQPDAEGKPAIYRGALWFNVKLYGGLRKQIGETILGRMEQGQGTPGQNPPWQLADVMGDPEWVAFATNWLATPEGESFEAEAIRQVNAAAKAAEQDTHHAPVAAAAAPPVQAAPAPVARPAGPPPAVPPASFAPPAPAAPPVAVQAGPPPAAIPAQATDLATVLGGLPPDEQAKMLALLQQNNKASS